MADTTRRFSFSHPTRYQGQTYPTAEADIDYGNGATQQGRIFADANGVYHTLDAEGNILDATPVHRLDEVVVTAPRRDNLLSDAFNRFLTESNDNARVSNTPHRQYNTHLEENALQGAKAHAAWDKEHPNLSAWRDAATAVPFAVAATPLAVGAGKAALGTAVGQTVRNGLVALMGNPIVDATNTALGLGFAGKGAYDISQGEFTPGTAMDLVGGLGLMAKGSSMFDRFLTSRKPTTPVKPAFTSELDWTPEGWFGKYRPKEYDATDIAALEAHIPEYHQIEQQAKANGTWLRKPDGSTWEGDPRGWVMSQSKNVRDNYRNEVLHHGEDTYFDDMSFYTDENGNNMTGDMLGDKVIWTSTNPKIAPTYGKDVYPFVIPKEAGIKTVADAQGRGWTEVLPGTTTDDLVYPNLAENSIVRIDNVVDPGPNISLTKVKDALPNETMIDYLKRKYIGDDLVLGQNVIRKSLYGNNGNFDLSNFNIFKGLIPVGVGLSGNALLTQPKN